MCKCLDKKEVYLLKVKCDLANLSRREIPCPHLRTTRVGGIRAVCSVAGEEGLSTRKEALLEIGQKSKCEEVSLASLSSGNYYVCYGVG